MQETTKIEVRSKPILSPTHSLDEGFESDPDRISTDSQLVAQTPAFDVVQHTDRDGMQHTQIRRSDNTGEASASSGGGSSSGPSSILCLEGEIDSEIRCDIDPKVVTAVKQQQLTSSPVASVAAAAAAKETRYRRVKTRAPPPPLGAHIFKPRSQSVESAIRGANAPLSLSKASTSNYDYTLNDMDILTQRGDVLSGRYVRVTVDPRRPTPHQPSSLYKLYHSASTQNIVHFSMAPYNQQTNSGASSLNYSNGSSATGSNTSSNKHHFSRYSTTHQPQHMPVSWTQSIPRQTRRYVAVCTFTSRGETYKKYFNFN